MSDDIHFNPVTEPDEPDEGKWESYGSIIHRGDLTSISYPQRYIPPPPKRVKYVPKCARCGEESVAIVCDDCRDSGRGMAVINPEGLR